MLKQTCISLGLCWALAGCGGSSTSNVQTAGSTSESSGGSSQDALSLGIQGPSLDLAVHALGCMLGTGPSGNRCVALAQMTGSTEAALTAADPVVVEGLSEAVAEAARQERKSVGMRLALARWFELSAAAIREAQGARSGALGTALASCAQRNNNHPPLDEVEHAHQIDLAYAKRTSALIVALNVPSNIDLGPYRAEADAFALMVLAHRLESVSHAEPEIREEALHALGEVLANNQTEHSNNSNPPNRNHENAREQANEVSLPALREYLSQRIQRTLPNVSQRELRDKLASNQ